MPKIHLDATKNNVARLKLGPKGRRFWEEVKPTLGWCWTLSTAAVLGLTLAGCSNDTPTRRRGEDSIERLRLVDLSGKAVAPFQDQESKAIVFFFVSTECPISNRYAPEMRRLHEKYYPLGVMFWLVYPDRTESRDIIRRHKDEYQFPFSALLDPRHELVKEAKVSVTPEVAVFSAGLDLVYHGRIDDRYVDFGKERPVPTTRDLQIALDAILSGKPVPNRSSPAVGCYISAL